MYPGLIPDPNVQGRLYLLSDVAGAWRSDNRGESWEFINNGLFNLNGVTLAVAPTDSNVLYAGTKAGMVRSDDAGKHWRVLSATKGEVTFEKPASYRAIVVSRHDPNRVYAGTKKGKLLSSTDGGERWTTVGTSEQPFGQEAIITAIQLDQNETQLFAASKLGIIRCELGQPQGSCQRISAVGALDLLVNNSDGMLYAAQGKKVGWSRDGGATWEFSSEIPHGEVSRLAISRTGSEGIKFVVGWRQDWNGGVFISADRGVTWASAGKNLHYDERRDPTRVWMKNFQRPNAVQIDPFNAEVLYYTDSWGVWRSDDSGQSWQEKIVGATNTCGSDIAISPDGTIYVAAMDQGLLRSRDGGTTYESVAPGSQLSRRAAGHVWRVAMLGHDPAGIVATSSPWEGHANQVVLGDTPTGMMQLVTTGLPAAYPKKNTMWGTGYARALAINPNNPRRVYLGIDGDDGGGLFISDDAGKSWRRSEGQPQSLRIYNGLAVDPTNSKRIVWGSCGQGGGVYQSDDEGRSWRRTSAGVGCVFDVAISRQGIIYAAGTANGPVLYASHNHGASWQLLHRADNGSALEAICLDPQDERRIFVGLVKWEEAAGGRVLYSPDAGKSWNDITGELPTNSGPASMVVSPSDRMLYLLLYAGSVYKRSVDHL